MSDAPYQYGFAPRAVRDLEKLPEAVASACVEFIAAALTHNPHRLGKELIEPWAGHWSARRGEYRVIYRIDEEQRSVLIVHIAHRGKVYRR